MSSLWKWKCNFPASHRDGYQKHNKGIRMDQGMHRIFFVQHSGNLVRTVRDGKRKYKDNIQNEGYTYMSKLRKSMVDFIYELGAYSGCHRMPERSFFYQGRQFPVCARCTGVCCGQLCALLFCVFYKIPVKVSVTCLAIMGIDWGLQECGVKSSTNRRRFLTGILGGFGLFSLYLTVIKSIFRRVHVILA